MLPLGLLQNVAAGIAVAVGPGLFSTTTELTLVHPVASLMVSVYVPAATPGKKLPVDVDTRLLNGEVV